MVIKNDLSSLHYKNTPFEKHFSSSFCNEKPREMKLVVCLVALLSISGTAQAQRRNNRRNNRNNRNNNNVPGKRDTLAAYISKLKSDGDGRYRMLEKISVKKLS